MARTAPSSQLWERRRQALLDTYSKKEGPYADIRRKLLDELYKAKKISILTKVPGTSLYEYQITIQLNKVGYVNVGFQVSFSKSELQVAVCSRDDDSDKTRYYNLTDNGGAIDLVDLDALEPTDDPTEPWPHLMNALTESHRVLGNVIYSWKYKRREAWKTALKIAAGCTAVLFVAGLVFMCARWWVFEPREAEQRARVQYDLVQHELDSQAYPVDTHPLGVVPDGTLRAIPNYGGDDTVLTQPRKVSITYGSSSKWCQSIKTDIPAGSAVAVAVETTSPFSHDSYTATHANGTLTICLVSGFSATDASQKLTAQLALQAKPEGLAN